MNEITTTLGILITLASLTTFLRLSNLHYFRNHV